MLLEISAVTADLGTNCQKDFKTVIKIIQNQSEEGWQQN